MTSSRQQRIVIVDYECMSALGVTLDETWQRLVGNASGIGYIDRYAASEQVLLGVSDMEFGGQIPATYALILLQTAPTQKSSVRRSPAARAPATDRGRLDPLATQVAWERARSIRG